MLSRKNWLGGGELLLKNGTKDIYAYSSHLHCVGPLALGDFCKIFLPNLGEDQKKSFTF